MNIISTESATWRIGTKVKGLKAKPISDLIDKSVSKHFLINTLEGNEPIDSSTVFCIGIGDEAWQQNSLLNKYEISGFDDNGWMICIPKKDNRIQFFESNEHGYIQGTFGATLNGIQNLQSLSKGDFICRNPNRIKDQWVVRRDLFLDSYIEVQS